MNQIKRRLTVKQVKAIDLVVLVLATVAIVLLFLMAANVIFPGNWLVSESGFNVKVLVTDISIVISTTGFIISFVSSYAKGKSIADAIDDGKETYDQYQADNITRDIIADTVANVETTYKEFTGANKKKAAMTEIHQKLLDKGIPFDAKEISDKVEKFISYTKVINAKDDQKL